MTGSYGHLNVQAMSNEFTNAVFLKVNVDENDVSWLCVCGGAGGGGDRKREGRSLHTKLHDNNKSIDQIVGTGVSFFVFACLPTSQTNSLS